MAKKRRKLSKHEMQHGGQHGARGRSRSDAALREHLKRKRDGTSARFSDRKTPWKRADTSWLSNLLKNGFDSSSHRDLLHAHHVLLRRPSYHPDVQEALGLLYMRCHHKLFKKLMRQIDSPQHRHVLLALTRKAVESTSAERVYALDAMARIGAEEACAVAWFLFAHHGQQTRQRCASVIGQCGTRRQLPLLDEEIANGSSRSSKATLKALERARQAILERFPDEAMVARQGSLTVLGEQGDAKHGALSLEEHASSSKEHFDMVRSIESLLDVQQQEHARPSSKKWRALQRFYALDDVSMDRQGGVLEHRHVPVSVKLFGGSVEVMRSFQILVVLLLIACVSPWLTLPLFLMAWGYYAYLTLSWNRVHGALLRRGNVREAQLKEDRVQGEWCLDVLARVHGAKDKKAGRHIIELPAFVEERMKNGARETLRVPVLLADLENEREGSEVILLFWDHEALTISQNGSWGLSRPYHVAFVVALMVVSVLRLLWVIVG